MLIKEADDLLNTTKSKLVRLLETALFGKPYDSFLYFDCYTVDSGKTAYSVFEIPVRVRRRALIFSQPKKITFSGGIPKGEDTEAHVVHRDIDSKFYIPVHQNEKALSSMATYIADFIRRFPKNNDTRLYYLLLSTGSEDFITKWEATVTAGKLIFKYKGYKKIRNSDLNKLASGHHGGKKEKVPDFIKHVAARLIKEKGIPKSRAFAIAVGNAQRIGALKPGTMKLTPKGKGFEAKHERHRAAVDLKKVD